MGTWGSMGPSYEGEVLLARLSFSLALYIYYCYTRERLGNILLLVHALSAWARGHCLAAAAIIISSATFPPSFFFFFFFFLLLAPFCSLRQWMPGLAPLVLKVLKVPP
jgi:hypothetical protein